MIYLIWYHKNYMHKSWQSEIIGHFLKVLEFLRLIFLLKIFLLKKTCSTQAYEPYYIHISLQVDIAGAFSSLFWMRYTMGTISAIKSNTDFPNGVILFLDCKNTKLSYHPKTWLKQDKSLQKNDTQKYTEVVKKETL